MPQPWPDTGAAARADLAECRALLCGGSRSFHAASLLLPARVRDPATALYAFCRVADDAIDLATPENRAAALAALHGRLDRAYAARPHPAAADRALARVVARHAVPRALLDALLEGFAWDAEARRYQDFPGLLAYAARVAGSVGAMMAVVMGARSQALVARACDLGIAMQLSNIARDVGEDARAGRLYLPQDWLRDAGIEPEAWLAHPVFSPALGGVVARLLDAAETLYVRGGAGIAGLPLACRPGIAAARFLYAGIGEAVRAQGCDSVRRRARVPGLRKLALAVRALAFVAAHGPMLAGQEAAETAFLVRAATASTPPRSERPRAARQARRDWVLDLFLRLERREQMAASR